MISEDNRPLNFFSELEKSITIKVSGHKHKNEEPITAQKKLAKRKFKVPVAKTNEASQIPNEKVSLSSAKKEGAMDHENTTLGKSVGDCNEEKLKTDSTIIPIQLIDRPSPYKVYRHQDYERVGRLSQKIHILYTWSFFLSWNK